MFTVSPKVLVPFILGLVATAIHWLVTGEFDENETVLLISDFAYAIVGYSLAPAPGVRQVDVDVLSRKRKPR